MINSNRSKMTATGSEEYVTEYSYSDSDGDYTALLQKEVKTSTDVSETSAGILSYGKEFLGNMTENLQADCVQSRQTLFVRYCPKGAKSTRQ